MNIFHYKPYFFIFLLSGFLGPVHAKYASSEKIFSDDIQTSCRDIAYSYMRDQGFKVSQMPDHCKRQFREKMHALIGQLQHTLKSGKADDFVSHNDVKTLMEVSLQPLAQYLDTIVFKTNLEFKISRSMQNVCEKEGISINGLYQDLADVFQEKKLEMYGILEEVLDTSEYRNRSEFTRFGQDYKKNRVREQKKIKNDALRERFYNDYLTQDELDEFVKEQMQPFVFFAQAAMTSLWFSELHRHIEDKHCAQTKIPLVVDKRSLLKPPSFCCKKK
ncbi:MAG: hypothetical protein V1855_04915 [bacterium]